MRLGSHLINVLAAAALLGAAAACSSDRSAIGGATGPGSPLVGGAPVAMRIASVSGTTGAGTAVAADNGGFGGWAWGQGDLGDGDGHHWHGWTGWVRRSLVDSLIVTVSKVEVLAAIPDTENAADSAADSAQAANGHGDDDHDDFEEHEFGWDTLAIVGSGHLDLAHLPDSASAGLTVASGTLAAGTYRHVRLFITGPMIYFDSLIVTPAGDSLQPGVGYPVTFPSADSTGAAIKTDESFTVPTGGGNVQLYFDPDDTIRHILVLNDSTIVVPPVVR